MSTFRAAVLIVSIALFVGVVAVGDAAAGEKFKLRTVKYGVKVESVEVGDQEGHIVLIYEAKGITSNREGKWFGEGWVHRMVLLIDTNLKTGQGSLEGYEEVTDRDGNKYYYRTDGKLTGKGRSEGEYTIVKGTGKFEGIQGKGNWVSPIVAQRQNYTDEEWEIELPRR